MKKAAKQLAVDRNRVESMLRMLEGNTHADDITRLHCEWLAPILDRLQGLQRESTVVV